MEIYLYKHYINDAIRLPVNPSKIEVQQAQKIDTFETVGHGNLKMIGNVGERKITLSSFFPVLQYGFRRDFRYNGLEYINKIKKWMNERDKMSVLIDDLDIYMLCVVTDLNYDIRDGSGDIYFTVNLEEFIVPEIKYNVNTSSTISTVTEETSTELMPNAYATVTAQNGVNVRSGAGINYDIIGGLGNGERIKLYRKEGEWWHTYYGNHGGYISAKYLSV